ncbi:MAG: hypothetical protein LBK13_00030 [Spirochaetales bacterium]|nr:hypothetical protein [Spirochaetales bacterium]
MENEQFIKKELGEISDFSEKNKIADGIYSDIYVRNNDPVKKLEDYKIAYAEMDKILSGISIKHEKVTTGYSSYVEACKNTTGYSLNEIKIFISYNDENYITHIWFDFYLEKLSIAEDLYRILEIITDTYDLIFVDWAWGFYSHVRQDGELKNKLIEISKNLAE